MGLETAKNILYEATWGESGFDVDDEDIPKALRFIAKHESLVVAMNCAESLISEEFKRLDWQPKLGVEVFQEIFSWDMLPSEDVLYAAANWLRMYYPELDEVVEMCWSALEQGEATSALVLLRDNIESFDFY